MEETSRKAREKSESEIAGSEAKTRLESKGVRRPQRTEREIPDQAYGGRGRVHN